MEAKLVSRLQDVVNYLSSWLPLTECHMVNFITKNLWENYVPQGIKDEFSSLGLEAVDRIFWSHVKHSQEDCSSRAPNFTKFLDDTLSMSLRGGKGEGIVMSQEQLWTRLAQWDRGACHQEGFMSRKKMHEVEVMSRAVASLACATGCTHVVDVGGGKGYMSSLLALSHKIPTLSIDSSEINTHGAADRTRKLAKVWNGLRRRAEEINKGETPPRRGKHWKSRQHQEEGPERKECPAAALYKQVTAYVKEDTDVGQIVEEQFGSDRSNLRLAVTGLHTCGNLASTCLRMFVGNRQVAALCCVGCCYHLLEEEFCRNPFWDDADPFPETFGFPMSNYLRNRRFSLGRNSRMLAAQSLDRIATRGQLASQPLLYRALLQVLLLERCGDDIPWGQVGHLSSKFPNFHDYVLKALNKLGVNIEVSREEIETLYKNHEVDGQKLHLFFLLRVTLAPIIETVVLLDRLLYLHEQGFQESFLVHLFDPVISPRCYCIIALREEIH